MALRICTVAVKDIRDVEHSIEVTAETLYEAIATALAALQQDNWVGEIGQGLTTAPAPPSPEAKFEVISRSQADELRRFRQTQPDAHFALGRAYANAGILEEAEREFRLVPGSDANRPLAQKFIRDLQVLRHPGQETN